LTWYGAWAPISGVIVPLEQEWSTTIVHTIHNTCLVEVQRFKPPSIARGADAILDAIEMIEVLYELMVFSSMGITHMKLSYGI